MNGVHELTLWQLGAAFVFVVILLIIVRIKKISREKQIIIASVRMTVQLILIGNILVYLFENPHPLATVGVIVVMEAFAIYTLFSRSKDRLSRPLRQIIALAMAAGTLSTLAYFLLIVIRITPWYDPQYFIPIAGMLIGNSMTGINLGITHLVDGMVDGRSRVEGALMLGATPKRAAKPIVDKAFDAAILPTINSMLGMGIVFLPGMMTGQILSGTSPVTAIYYQIAIMLGILGAVSLTVILFVQLGAKVFFNAQDQYRSLADQDASGRPQTDDGASADSRP